jgi:hypothetical protein
MVQAVFCTIASETEVEGALSQARAEGIRPKDVLLITERASLSWVACPESQINRSIKAGVLGGALVGWLIGLGTLLYVPELMRSMGALSIPAFTAFGWALFGMIVGSGGLFARPALPSSLLPHLEEAIEKGKILVSLKVDTRRELDKLAANFSVNGETDIHEVEIAAA